MTASRYGTGALGGGSELELERLAAGEAVADPGTIGWLQGLGVGPGWRCWEVGAGRGSIARWLAARVADNGHQQGFVLATDIDVQPMEDQLPPALQLMQHDITRDPAPGGTFDLVHARFVIEHLPEREHALDMMCSVLAPGGWLLLESIVSFPTGSSPHPPFRDALLAVEAVLAETIGTDATWGRQFPAPLQHRGLTDIDVAMRLPTTGGQNASARCWALTVTRLRDQILTRGLTDDDTLDAALRLLEDPTFYDFTFATAACWGRKPPDRAEHPVTSGDGPRCAVSS